MRIALVGTAWPMRGGIAQYTALLARELAHHHDVELVSFTRQYPKLLFPGRTQIDASETSLRYPNTPLIDTISPRSWQRTVRHLRAWHPDGLVLMYWMPFFAPAYGWIARGVRRASGSSPGRRLDGASPRVVALLHNLIPHERRPFDLPLTRWLMGAVDAYVVQSKAVQDDLLRLSPHAQFRHTPHPVYPQFGEPMDKQQARAQLGIAAGEPMLLFFGFVRPYKGLEVLLAALALVRRTLPAKLLVVGEFYQPRERTDAQIAALGLTEAVTVRDDYVANDEVGRYFAAADVVVLPYRSATQSGIVPIAWHLERPVICSDVGGLSEVVEDGRTGLVVPPSDAPALAAAILRYFAEGLEARFVPAIREERDRYSWGRMADTVVELVRG